MKYIRTKDEVYEIVEGIILTSFPPKYQIKNKEDSVFMDDVIAQADDIKELCDEFVVAYEDGARIVYHDLEWAKTKAKASLELGNKSIIYGAIWADKGLIYVTKLNRKGVLELL